MWVFPLAAAVVAFAFAAALARRFAHTRRLHLAMWCAALVVYGLASLAVAGGALSGWSRALFEVYWTLGAVLNVPQPLPVRSICFGEARSWTWRVWVVLAFVFAYTVAVTPGRRDRSLGARGAAPVREGGLR